ncbi:hypothetical protein D0T84_10945 [Dysgonomonas sp. 521]|uniref:hypothetical protein n=1 Tax=Dysgonomonas sp. 521 TaxID=2302932 RepID=UPI0013D395F3|nr:hypothetical protein [Dysgonomonas sp. 521]NDV95428.1 hypothetical protein [Dysgonomonas sp. 521]
MMKDKLAEIVDDLQPFLLEKGFTRRGRQFSFVRKYKTDYKRQEQISFQGRQHGNDPDTIYVSCFIGLYYPEVRKIYKSIITDHLSDYPILAGSISHFSPSDNYLSVCYKQNVNRESVVSEIKEELISGAFHLIEIFPDLNSIYEGILNEHPFLKNRLWGSLQYSDKLEVASIIYALQGFDAVKGWLEKNLNDDLSVIDKFKELDNKI